MLQSKTLTKHLLRVYRASLRPSDDELGRRAAQRQRGRGRGWGGGRGRGGATAMVAKWTQERGDRAAMGVLRGLRVRGREENVEVEEFVNRVVGVLDVRDEK